MIHIIDDFYIVVSDKTYVLADYKGKHDKKGNPVYNAIGYYTDIAGALKQCAKCLFARGLEGKTASLHEAIEMFNEINKSLERKLEEVSE